MSDRVAQLLKEREELERSVKHKGFHAVFLIAVVITAWLEAWRSGDPWRAVWGLSVAVLVIAGVLSMSRAEGKRKLGYTDKLIGLERGGGD